MFDADPILPAGGDSDSELVPLHDREYRVRAFRTPDGNLLVRGAVRDQKPPGLYFADDPEPMVIHHMQVDLTVTLHKMTIVAADVRFLTNPHTTCPKVAADYSNLVGLSITRGFTHKVRELFGGPRGCSHTTALLQAMGPVAVQSIWSLTALDMRKAGEPMFVGPNRQEPVEQRMKRVASNLNTCHVWAEGGEHIDAIRDGSAALPLFALNRMRKLGHSLD